MTKKSARSDGARLAGWNRMRFKSLRELDGRAQIMISLSRFQPALLSLFRFITGLLLLQYGIAKIFKFPALPYFADIPPLLYAAGALELVLGAALMIGLFTRISAFVLSGEMAFA